MGISGLLPALKSIQVTKHLSEYSGKTIAVDAYVWLHRGLYACATEVATGKSTQKYVDYAMHRVRLLKYHGIVPYIVFDGGPLPAKKGTENDRKAKRDENLARGKALAAQGKHGDARDCYTKCVDVTPQMAFQFIKALRAENVSYVVAPYEADAQLAYLEKAGLVDAILTEDSDLLVFGSKTILYKFDPVARTVVSISRSQFGSVTTASSDSISLYGWSDSQFRSMAILSGCDYLPSISGIGLKTAWSLLRKWKTAEQVVRAVTLEGKRKVPSGYWKEFQLAEKCFLHQRVYCPLAERLVHLTAVGSDWNEVYDAYVGGDIDPGLAKQIALGDVCPVSRCAMTDINPSYKPRVLKPIPAAVVSPNKSAKSQGKMRQNLPSTGGILNFFGPNPIIPPRVKDGPVAAPKPNLSGKASGKRTLAEVMDQDLERKKRHRKSSSPLKSSQLKQSRFFIAHPQSRSSSVQRRHSEGIVGALAGASGVLDDDKENEQIMGDDEEVESSEPEPDGSDLSLKVQYDVFDEDTTRMDLDLGNFPDPVEQEDGYISPTPSCSRDAQDLSSPAKPSARAHEDEMGPSVLDPSDQDEDFGADAISSPISMKRPNAFNYRPKVYESPTRLSKQAWNAKALVEPRPTSTDEINSDIEDVPSPVLYRGPDLRRILREDTESDLETSLGVRIGRGRPDYSSEELGSGSTSPPSPSPETPASRDPLPTAAIFGDASKVVVDVDEFGTLDLDEEDQGCEDEIASRTKAVMDGWRQKWAVPSASVGKGGCKPPGQTRGFNTLKKPLTKPKVSATPNIATLSKTITAPGMGALRHSELRRSETNVTPAGRHSLRDQYQPPKSAPSKMGVSLVTSGGASWSKSATQSRTSLVFFESAKTKVADLISDEEIRLG